MKRDFFFQLNFNLFRKVIRDQIKNLVMRANQVDASNNKLMSKNMDFCVNMKIHICMRLTTAENVSKMEVYIVYESRRLFAGIQVKIEMCKCTCVLG